MGKSKIELPDGTVIQISPDLSPEQITALITALRSSTSVQHTKSQQSSNESGKEIIERISPDQRWKEGSKRERLAMFLRNNFNPDTWFTAKEVLDQQLAFVPRLIFGETPAIHTYMKRLSDDGLLERRKQSNRVYYKLTDNMLNRYPDFKLNEMKEIMMETARE